MAKFRTNETLAKEVGESRETIRRYIRLTELIPPILDLVDNGKVAMRPAVELSYLPKEQQEILYDVMQSEVGGGRDIVHLVRRKTEPSRAV